MRIAGKINGRVAGGVLIGLVTLALGCWLADRAFGYVEPLRTGGDQAGAARDGGQGVDGDDGDFPSLPRPADTREFHPLRRGDAFQALYESALEPAKVMAVYASALAAQGFSREGGERKNENDFDAEGRPRVYPFALAFRRGTWRVDLQFFAPEAGNRSEYRLSVLRFGRPGSGNERQA